MRDTSRRLAPAFAWLDAGRVARAGLDAVAAGRPVSVPGAQYKAIVPLARIVPRRVLRIGRKGIPAELMAVLADAGLDSGMAHGIRRLVRS